MSDNSRQDHKTREGGQQTSLSELSLWIAGREIMGEVLEKQKTKKVYEDQNPAGLLPAIEYCFQCWPVYLSLKKNGVDEERIAFQSIDSEVILSL